MNQCYPYLKKIERMLHISEILKLHVQLKISGDFSLTIFLFGLQNDVHILKEGDKVGASDATLLNMLNISPFNYGLIVEMVYDSGTMFEPKILDIKPEDIRAKFLEVSRVGFTTEKEAQARCKEENILSFILVLVVLSLWKRILRHRRCDHSASLRTNRLAFGLILANMLFPG